MKRNLAKWLSALLIACLLIPAPLALMEAPEISEPELTEALPGEEALDGPVEEMPLELGDEESATAHGSQTAEVGQTVESDDQALKLGAEEEPLTIESAPLEAELSVYPKEESRFPDNEFRKLLGMFDEDGDGVFSDEELGKITKLDFWHYQELNKIDIVTSLEGLQYLPGLEYLDISLSWPESVLNELDVSHNPKLETLKCGGQEGLTELDLSQNPQLKKLDCAGTALTELDLSHNPKLESLDCAGTALTKLDLSHNLKLVSLVCGWSGKGFITTLNLGDKPELQELDCKGNQLTTLDVSHCPKLDFLFCNGNQLTTLDVSHCPELAFLGCSDNKLSTLKMGEHSKLKTLSCSNNKLQTLDVSKLPNLSYLYCEDNPIVKLDISMLELSIITAEDDPINENGHLVYGNFRYDEEGNRSFDTAGIIIDAGAELVTGLPKGDSIPIDAKHFPDDVFRGFVSWKFDINQNGKLSQGEIAAATIVGYSSEGEGQGRTSIGGVTSLKGIELLPNLSVIRLSDCPALKSADFTNNPKLKVLEISNSGLKTLNISHNTELAELNISGNELTELDVSHIGLYVLECYDNKLQTLKLGRQEKLEYLICRDNPFTSLDVSGYERFIKGLKSPDMSVNKEGSADCYSCEDCYVSVNSNVLLITDDGIPVYKLTGNVKRTVSIGDRFRIALDGMTATAYRSDNKSVAEVSRDGVVTAKAVGVAIISVKAQGRILKIKLTVVKSTRPTGIHLKPSGTWKVDLTDDNMKTIKAILEPEGALGTIEWKSSDKSIAQVKNGKVKLLKEGNVIITARVKEIKKTASVRLNVRDCHAPRRIAINQGTKGTIRQGKIATLTIKITGTKGYEPRKAVTWKSSNPRVVAVNSKGKIKAVAPGIATITVTAEKVKASIKIRVK